MSQQFKVSEEYYHEPHEPTRTKSKATYRDGTNEEEILRYSLSSILFILSVLAFMLAFSRS
jgi:hypothetical protein